MRTEAGGHGAWMPQSGCVYVFEIMSTGTALHEVSLPRCDPFLCRDVQNMEKKLESGACLCVLPKIKYTLLRD